MGYLINNLADMDTNDKQRNSVPLHIKGGESTSRLFSQSGN